MKAPFRFGNIRFGFIIFLGLVVFCLAQLSWWIIYQINLNRQLYQLRIDLLDLEIESVSARVNYDFRRTAELARSAYVSSGGSLEELRQCLDKMTSDPVMAGYYIARKGGNTPIVSGETDSTFFYSLGEGNVLYFDSDYPNLLLGARRSHLTFETPKRLDGQNMIWVETEMFSVDSTLLARMQDESIRGSVMFISEGGFFLLIIMFGAYLIYRTLQRSEKLKSQQVNFIQAVTHEFRTPLTSLRLYLETLASGSVERENAGRLYSKMLTDCDRLDKMVGDALEAGQLVGEKYRLKLTDTDFSKDVKECLDRITPQVLRMNGKLIRDIEDEIFIRSNHQALDRVIRELIDNALKYAPPERRVIQVRLTKSKGEAALKVEDKGVGLPPREQNQIFDRFYRVDSSVARNVRGTGLGLYLARHIVKAHGGSIEADSKGENKGSTFTVRLPLARP